jgi:hypothetical protein
MGLEEAPMTPPVKPLGTRGNLLLVSRQTIAQSRLLRSLATEVRINASDVCSDSAAACARSREIRAESAALRRDGR